MPLLEKPQQGHFWEDFFPPVDIPMVPDRPWVQCNIPIPPGLYKELCKLVMQKMDARVFKPSNSSYWSRWFCGLKKDGKSLCIVQLLEPLNQVTIAHSGVPPFTEHLAEQFAGHACNSMLDLYIGYDKQALDPSSHDLTIFQTPYRVLQLTTLPMGWTNSVPRFHNNVIHILQPEISHVTQPYIDDVPVKGPTTRYLQDNGEPETIPGNPGIQQFVWEHFQDLNHIVQWVKYSGSTFPGLKTTLCTKEITVPGHCCTMEERLPDESRVTKIANWRPCKDLMDVHAFLGTIGICRLFIKNFSHHAHHLVKLTRKAAPWEFGQDQISAMEDLKKALLSPPALWPIDYASMAPVILSVETSQISVSFRLSQCNLDDSKHGYYMWFGSITLNDREAKFSQLKLKLYGLYCALRSLKLYLIHIQNLIIEVNARYIKAMLQNPDISLSASINRWILAILMFHSTLVHVPGTHHTPNGDEHAWLLPSEIASIALVYSSFKLIQAPAIIITLFWPLLWRCDHLVETKNYQSMLNRHFAITRRIASRNYFVHKSALYRHSLSILEASDFNHSIFPQVLPVSPRWKQLSLRIKASQDWSLELLQQSVASKLSYSKVLRAIAAPSLFGLFSHTINWNS